MFRNSDDGEEINNSLDFLIREPEYKKEIYQIKEEIKQNENLYKLYGINTERNLNVIITKVTNVSEKENPNFIKRLLITIKLIEENKLLVENLWLEKMNSKESVYNLYISELTNTIYRNEYNLISLNNYMSSTKNTYKDNIQILILIVQKMKYFQKYEFSHLNLHPNNIFINIKNNSLIYFGPPKLSNNFSNDCTYLWYSSPEEIFIPDKIFQNDDIAKLNDIWCLGCIICELFFVNFPLFQVYSSNEKLFKIIDTLGFPSYNEVEDYINQYQYDSLYKRSLNHSQENNLFEMLISPKEKKSNLYYFKTELIDIIKGCLTYDIKKRLKLEDILKKLEYLNNNISSEFHSKILNNINISNESSSDNFDIKKRTHDIKCIINNKSIESDKYKEINKDNNNKSIEINDIKLINNKFDNLYPKIQNNINNNRYEFNNNKSNLNNIIKKEMDIRRNNIKYRKESDKKENIMDYFKEEKKEIVKDEYKELEESKYIIFILFSNL